MNDVRFEIFFGSSAEPASAKLNAWLEANRDVNLLGYNYQMYHTGHSICITYRKVEDECESQVLNRVLS